MCGIKCSVHNTFNDKSSHFSDGDYKETYLGTIAACPHLTPEMFRKQKHKAAFILGLSGTFYKRTMN